LCSGEGSAGDVLGEGAAAEPQGDGGQGPGDGGPQVQHAEEGNTCALVWPRRVHTHSYVFTP